jgi:hypothetical protein
MRKFTIVQLIFHLLNHLAVSTTANLVLVFALDFQWSVLVYRALNTLTSTRLLLHVRRVVEYSSDRRKEALTPKEDSGETTLDLPLVRVDRTFLRLSGGTETHSHSFRDHAVESHKA